MTLHGDRWDGVLNSEWEIERASPYGFEQALDRLDAHTYTMLTIQSEGEQHLTIGGGGGRYIVYASFDNEDFWNLLRSQPETGRVLLNVGGQEGDFSASQVVSKEQARAAGLAFLGSGCLDRKQQWQKQ